MKAVSGQPLGRMTQTIREQFAEITEKALQQFISERVSDRLKNALAREQEAVKPEPADAPFCWMTATQAHLPPLVQRCLEVRLAPGPSVLYTRYRISRTGGPNS